MMVNELVQAEWRVTHLRDQIAALGLQPKGRTRRALAQQLAERFLDSARLTESVSELSDEERRYFVTLLFQANVHGFYAVPHGQSLWQEFSTPWTTLAQSIKRGGLALETENGDLFLPHVARRRLPQLHLTFTGTTEPDRIVPSADPRRILTQIQQLLGILQSETFRLRDQLRWRAPDYPYAQSVVCWPLMPSDARQLMSNLDMDGTIELRPPEPYLDEASLKTLAELLGISADWVEFVYHIIVATGVVRAGSPLTVDDDLVDAWMALTPGRQLSVVYQLFRSQAPWSVWWSLWREGRIRVSRDYHGYWGLISVDESMAVSSTNLRWVLLELLSFLPHDTWIATEDVVRRLEELFPNSDTHRYLMGVKLDDVEGRWFGFLRDALLQLLTGPLWALGLVDVGPSLDAPRAIRLRGLQALHWGRVTEVPIGALGQLNAKGLRFIAAEHTLEIETPVPPEFLTFLLQWAKPAGFSRNVVRYQLDPTRLHETFERGMDPDALAEAWGLSIGSETLPEIADWWDYWWTRYGHVRIYPAQAMLQTRDAVTMRELLVALPRLQESILGILTPSAALLHDQDVDQLLNDLARQGYMPKETS